MQVVYSPRHLAHDIDTETFMGVAIPANEVAERGRADPIRPRGRRRVRARRPDRSRRVADHGRPRRGPRPVPRGRPGRRSGPRRSRARSCRPTRIRTSRCSRACRPMRSSDWSASRSHVGGRAGFWGLDSAAPLVAGTYDAARAAVDVALTAMDLVLGGETAAYGLCRPPGHHAARSMYGGYCFFNNAAIVAHAITARPASGSRSSTSTTTTATAPSRSSGGAATSATCRSTPIPERAYPYFLGRADETGEGDGRRREPEHPAAGGRHERRLPRGHGPGGRGASRPAPGSVVVVSLGFDTYGLDPIGDFALTTEVYHEVGRRVGGARSAAGDPAGGRLPPTVARARTRGPGCVAPRAGRSTRCRRPASASTGRSADPGARPGDARDERSPSSRARDADLAAIVDRYRPAASVGSTCQGSGRSSTSCSSSRYRWPRRGPRSIAWWRRPIR